MSDIQYIQGTIIDWHNFLCPIHGVIYFSPEPDAPCPKCFEDEMKTINEERAMTKPTETDIDLLAHKIIDIVLEFADETQEDEHTTQPTYRDAILRGCWIAVSNYLCEYFEVHNDDTENNDTDKRAG